MNQFLMRGQNALLDQMQEDRANVDYKFSYLFQQTSISPPPDRPPTSRPLCATPGHQVSQGSILMVEQPGRHEVNNTGTVG